MKAAVMRGGQLVVDEIADPRRATGSCWCARWPAGSAARTCTPWPTATCWSSCPTRPARTAGDGMPSPQMMDLAHDVVMGHEFAAEVVELGPDLADGGGNHEVGDVVVSPAGRLRGRRRARGRLLEPLPGRLRRAHGAERPAVPRRAQRARRSSGRAHRAHGGRAARREPVADRGRPRRGGARGRAGRAGRHRRAGPGRGRAHHRRRLLPHAPGPGHAPWAPTRSSTRRWNRPSRPGGATGRASPDRGVRGRGRARDARRGHASTPRATPRSWWSACACSPTRCARCWPWARSSTSSSCSATTRSSSPRRCAGSPRASSTWPP